MKIFNTCVLENIRSHLLFSAAIFMFASVLLFALIQVSEAQIDNPDTVIVATESSHVDGEGKGAGGGGGGGGGGNGGDGEGGGEGNGGGGGGGGHDEDSEQGNNLSFPVIAADGYGIVLVASSSFTVPYEGPYTGLSADELAALEGGTWYAQKTEGNLWQAEYAVNPSDTTVGVYGVDWGDNIEAVNPVSGNPFRIEVSLYNKPDISMLGYQMELLANPSSPDEVQGTNDETYASEFASIVSDDPKLIIQDITNVCTTDLAWAGSAWTLDDVDLDDDSVSFGPELNVGGKYIYGVSKGGWRPMSAGMYRVTMYMPDSDILLEDAVVGNYTDWTAVAVSTEEDEEVRAATPVIDAEHNLTYVDVTTVDGSGGRKPGDSDTETVDPCAVVVDDPPATTTDPVATTTDPVDDTIDPVEEERSSRSSSGSRIVRVPVPLVAGESITLYDLDDTQRAELQGRMYKLQTEYLKVLRLMLVKRLEEMVSLLQIQLK